MGFGENDGQVKVANRTNWRNVLLPVMGLLLLGCAIAIAYALSEPATDLVRNQFSNIPSGDEVQAAVAFGIFIIVLLIYAVAYAIFAPKPPKMISENELAKEKKEMDREKLERRRRRRQMNQQAAQERKKK